MANNYIVTANKASAVNQCVAGNFTGPNDINLITAKFSRLEISTITQNGLKLVKEVGIYGRIEVLLLYRQPGQTKDSLFILTHKHYVSILDCVETPQDTYDIVTKRAGNVFDASSRPAESGNIVIIDPSRKVIALRLYDGLLKIIPIDKTRVGDLEAFNIRLEESVVPDICFLYGYTSPTIAFIHREQSGSCHVKTYELSLKEKEFVQGPWSRDNVATNASIIIPVPLPHGGAIIIALESIVYINNERHNVIDPAMIKQSPITCWEKIDERHYLLGDLSGRLFLLTLLPNTYRSDEIDTMELDLIGEVSIPNCITYLDNGYVHIGSKLGDSQLTKIAWDKGKLVRNDEGSALVVCESYPNLGPILDMCLVDLQRQGQGQLVTCSGHQKDGSLKIIRNGIGINELGSMDIDRVKGVWSLQIGPNQLKDTHIFVTFYSTSYLMICKACGNFRNIVEDDGFDRNSRTVLCTNVGYNQIVQVTRKAIRLISSINKQLVDTWTLPSGNEIFKVSNTQADLICADGKNIYFFGIGQGKLILLWEKELESEIACFDITPLENSTRMLSLGFWFNKDIVICGLDDFIELHREDLQSDIVPRSIITAKFEDTYYLLCALGDGVVFYYNLNPITGTLSNCKKVTLGTYETILRPFKSQPTTSIFACSDRPTVIYSSNNKLVFSNVNLKEVNYICTLNTQYYPDSLVLVSDSDMLFGTIDKIQKLHIRTVPLHESPIKIAHQQSTQTFGLLTTRKDKQGANGLEPVRPSVSTTAHSKSSALSMSSGAARPTGVASSDLMEFDSSSFLVVDQHTFEVLHSHQFMATETAMSILSTRLGETCEEYFVVGTAFVNMDEPEPKQGRLIVFRWSQESSLQQVAELSIKGCPYSLCEFDGKFLAGVNATVNLVELNSRRDLHIECTSINAIMALFLKRKGNLILMGDLMRSMSLLSYKPLQSHFEEVARDFNPSWMTEVEILDEDTFLGAEHNFNIFVCHRDSKATNEHDRQHLQQVGWFHLGDSVNVFHHGSLVVQHPSESSIELKRTTLFATVDGLVGLILGLDPELYRKLEQIEESLRGITKSVGKIDHKDWRAFAVSKFSQHSHGFIDGDLVETFLDLNQSQMQRVSDSVNMPVKEIVKLIEELSRLH